VHNINMENSNYNSLTQSLIQSGILQNDTETLQNTQNFFENSKEKTDSKIENNKVRKRINQYDLDLVQNNLKEDLRGKIGLKTYFSIKILKHIFGLKTLNNEKMNNFFQKFFPKIYQAKLIKENISKILELEVNFKSLSNKTVPYGEAQKRYDEIVKYLSCANEIEAKLKNKF